MGRSVCAELTNMCMLTRGSQVLVQEKHSKYGSGIIFPGGHVEDGEPITASVIREMKEETGLTIKNPVLCGIKDWIEDDGSRYIVFLYRAEEYEGELCSSEEGPVFWAEKEKLSSLPVIWGLLDLMEIFEKQAYPEYFLREENGEYHGELIR